MNNQRVAVSNSQSTRIGFPRLNTALFVFALVLILAACSAAPQPAALQVADVPEGAVLVELAYLNHGPVRSIMAEIDALLLEYDGKVAVQRYDFGTPEGEAFARERGLTEHTPIVVFVDDKMEFDLNGRIVKFYSFPQGQGTGVAPDGAWSLEDLRAVLDAVTNR